MMIRLGILQTGEKNPEMPESSPCYGDLFIDMFSPFGDTLSLDFIQVHEGVFPSSVGSYDGYLVTGSAAGVYDDFDWIAPLKTFLQAAFAAGKPLIGICFGHQMIAESLGGSVVKWPGGWRLGARSIPLLDAGDFFPSDVNSLTLLNVHQDQVTQLPKGAILLAGDDACPIAAFHIGDQVLCFQGHPEFTPSVLGDLTDMLERQGKVASDIADKARVSLPAPHNGRAVAGIIVNFLIRALTPKH